MAMSKAQRSKDERMCRLFLDDFHGSGGGSREVQDVPTGQRCEGSKRAVAGDSKAEPRRSVLSLERVSQCNNEA